MSIGFAPLCRRDSVGRVGCFRCEFGEVWKGWLSYCATSLLRRRSVSRRFGRRVGVLWVWGKGLWDRCGWRDRVVSLGDSGSAFDGGVHDEEGGFG